MQTFGRAIQILALLGLAVSCPLQAQTLKGSRASMERQNMLAVSYGYSFLENSQAVTRFVDSGHLVKIQQNHLLELHNVSYPYARPAVKTFLERLSQQYSNACGERLTVTSLTRPMNKQPANASQDSVHPTGMAVDLRIPNKSKCRSWLESTLLSLEKADLLDVTRERYPPHYHVAVFTQPYEAYVANAKQGSSEYTVRKGDSLSVIASRTGASVAQLRAANGIRGDMIKAGQILQVPGNPPATTPAASQQTIASIAPATVPVATEHVVETTIAANTTSNQETTISQASHKVRRGETLWRIARLYGTSVSQIRELNDLRDDLLQVGQELHLNP